MLWSEHDGCLKKKCDLFYDQYLPQIKHKSADCIFHLKVRINSFIWSTKRFLYDIRELRYKPNNMGYQSSSISSNEQSNILKSETPAIFV